MVDDKFEWDDEKDDENHAKHGVSFDHARHVFADAFAVGEVDDRFDYDEERFTLTGMVAIRRLYRTRRAGPHHYGQTGNQA